MNKLNVNFTEFEAKFYPVDKDEYREKLQKIGAKLITPERKMRRAIVDSEVYPQLTCTYIRVRDEGTSVRLSAKTSASENGKISDQKEIDVEVTDYDKAIKIIESMGFRFTMYQENLRETWKFREAYVEIDTWPGLESYTEVEAQSEEVVREIAEELGFMWEDRIITSVKEVYMKVYGLSREEVNKRINYITFENNPFKNLAKNETSS